jgi:hypothetical protein
MLLDWTSTLFLKGATMQEFKEIRVEIRTGKPGVAGLTVKVLGHDNRLFYHATSIGVDEDARAQVQSILDWAHRFHQTDSVNTPSEAKILSKS